MDENNEFIFYKCSCIVYSAVWLAENNDSQLIYFVQK